MAFNFNWSPLTADADFYSRARDLLTKALNKSPKPPIIVDDIFVSELNLGTVPPDLEILEIGDLAEDRFRGIFKMCYTGDAFLTLKTRVQVSTVCDILQRVKNVKTNKRLIGKPLKHLSRLETVVHLSSAPGCRLRPYHSSHDHLIRDQALSVYHLGILQTKGPYVSFPKRSARVPQGIIYLRLNSVRPRLSSAHHRAAAAQPHDG